MNTNGCVWITCFNKQTSSSFATGRKIKFPTRQLLFCWADFRFSAREVCFAAVLQELAEELANFRKLSSLVSSFYHLVFHFDWKIRRVLRVDMKVNTLVHKRHGKWQERKFD